MRESIKTVKIRGNLTINNKFNFKGVSGEYEYNVYSNKNMKGFLNIINSDELLRNFNDIEKFVFNGKGLTLKGEVSSWTFGGDDIMYFEIEELIEKIKNSDKSPNKIKVLYYVPYISGLARSIKKYWCEDEDYIVKFSSKEFTIMANGFLVTFYEHINLLNHENPDKVFNRLLFPRIIKPMNNIEDIYDKLNYWEKFLDEVMLVLSLILFKRLTSFGYLAEIFSAEDESIQTIKYISTKKRSCDDYLLDNGFFFRKYFTSENISILVESFLNLDNEKREKLLRIINAYLTISELEVFEPQFKDAYFATEAISKLIVESNLGSEELIITACKSAGIDLDSVAFEPSIKSKKLRWLISEYRNELTHFNFETYFSIDQMIDEFSKMMNILRKLIFHFLVPELKSFPYPRDKFKIQNLS